MIRILFIIVIISTFLSCRTGLNSIAESSDKSNSKGNICDINYDAYYSKPIGDLFRIKDIENYDYHRFVTDGGCLQFLILKYNIQNSENFHKLYIFPAEFKHQSPCLKNYPKEIWDLNLFLKEKILKVEVHCQ